VVLEQELINKLLKIRALFCVKKLGQTLFEECSERAHARFKPHVAQNIVIIALQFFHNVISSVDAPFAEVLVVTFFDDVFC